MPALPSWLRLENACCCNESLYRNFVRIRLVLVLGLLIVLTGAAVIGKMCQVYFFCLSMEGDMGLGEAAASLHLVPVLCYLLVFVSDQLTWFIRDAFAGGVLEGTRRNIIVICSSLVPGARPCRRAKNAADLFVLACVEGPVVGAVVSSVLGGGIGRFPGAYLRGAAICICPLFLLDTLGRVCGSGSPAMAAKLDALACAPTSWNLGSSLFTAPEEDWEAARSPLATPMGERWTSAAKGPLRTAALYMLSSNALFALNALLVGVHGSGAAGLALFLALVVALGLVRRRLFPGVGPLFHFLINFSLLLSLGFVAASLVRAREQDATTIGTRLVGGASANYTGVRRPGTYPICGLRWGNTSLPEERQLTVLDLLLLADAMYAGSAESIDQYVREGTAGTALAGVERVDLEDYGAVARMAVFRLPGLGVQVLAARGTQVTKEFLKDIDLYIGTAILQAAGAFMPAVAFLTEEMVQNYLYYFSVWNFVGDPTVRRVASRLRDLQADGDARGYATVVTGHSLGGMLVTAAAIRAGAAVVAFSPPGLVNNARLLGIDTSVLRTDVFQVQPAGDVVTSIDAHVGQVQMIACSKRSPISCHRSPTTLCELFRNCGDPRGRTLGGPGLGAEWCVQE